MILSLCTVQQVLLYLERDAIFNGQLLREQPCSCLAVTDFARLWVDSIQGRLAILVFPDLC